MRPLIQFLAIAVMTMAATPFPAAAQIFDNPKNLQVLPEDTDPGTLRNTMRSFAMGTGLRCVSCHAGEEGQDMRTIDFSDDSKALKNKARVMLKMVNEINNNHLAQYGDDRVKVECVTCHRGVSKPRQIGEELALAGAEGGADGLKARYTELRERYYGGHSYDFSDFTISEVARSRAEAGKMDEAAAVLDMMLEEDPESFSGHFIYGELTRHNGDLAAALGHFKKALEIKPDAGFVARRITEIEAELAGNAEQ